MYILHLGTSAKNGVGLRLPVEFIFAQITSKDESSAVVVSVTEKQAHSFNKLQIVFIFVTEQVPTVRQS